MPMLKKISKALKSKQVIITFTLGNFLLTRHTNSFKRLLAGLLLAISRKRYSSNALNFMETEKTKDDSF